MAILQRAPALISWAIAPIVGLAAVACDNAVESAVRARLIDPQSALFSEVETHGETTCGFVNSKNSLGGYVGPQAFVYHDGVVIFATDEDASHTPAVGTCGQAVKDAVNSEGFKRIKRRVAAQSGE
jgi:hypothetical protein